MTDEQLHQPHQLRHEEYKGEDGKSEECVAENFADDIPVQDAHDANGECSTVATTFALPRYPGFVLEAGERYFRSSKPSRERGEDSPGKPSALESAGWRYAQILPVHEFFKMMADIPSISACVIPVLGFFASDRVPPK